MPRPSRPWFHTRKMQWFTTIGGKQLPLGINDPNNLDAAIEALTRLRAALAGTLPETEHRPPIPTVSPPAPPRTVAEVVAEFLERRKHKMSPGCHKTYSIALGHFAAALGSRPLSSLTGEEIEDWADKPAWSNSTRHDYLGVVQTLLKWAKNPLTIKRPPKESRGAEAVLTDEQFGKVIAAANGDLGQLLRVLRETGARPQEIARLTVDTVDWGNTCTRTKVHKSAKHGVERVIHFNAEAMRILETQRKRHRSGVLFRNKTGKAFNKDGIVHRLAAISEQVGFRATAYFARHGFATRALVSGIPDAVVAELLGHRGTSMVAKHYGHVAGQSRILKEAVEQMGKKKTG